MFNASSRDRRSSQILLMTLGIGAPNALNVWAAAFEGFNSELASIYQSEAIYYGLNYLLIKVDHQVLSHYGLDSHC